MKTGCRYETDFGAALVQIVQDAEEQALLHVYDFEGEAGETGLQRGEELWYEARDTTLRELSYDIPLTVNLKKVFILAFIAAVNFYIAERDQEEPKEVIRRIDPFELDDVDSDDIMRGW